MNELYDDLVAERDKYGTVMNDDECVNLLNSVAWKHRPHWGLTGKDFGAGVGTRYDGRQCSHDTLLNKSTNLIYDVLESAGAASRPQLTTGVTHTQSNRPWVPAIEPRDPTAPVILKTKLGATLFSLVDLFQHERQRGDETIRRLRDDMGVTFLRVFWRKGTGAEGDYWNNAGHRSLVRSNLQQLPVSLMREAMDWTRGHGMKIAHCVFADNLGMSMSDQDRFVDGWLQAESDYRDVTEYAEVFNEPLGGHGGDIETLQRHARRLRAGLGNGVLVALGAPRTVHNGDDRQAIEAEVRDMHAGCPEANLITVHFLRRYHDSSVNNNPQRAPEIGPWAPLKRSNGEPIGPDSSVADTDDPQHLEANFRETNRAGYEWYVYHDDRLIRPRDANVWERHNWSAIASALKAASGGGNGGGGGGGGPVQPGVDKLLPGQSLTAGQRLRSPNGTHYLEYQGDGNVVIYETDVRPIWASQSGGIPPGRFEMQTDGNLVLYSEDGTPRRATGTYNNPGAMVQLQDDGLLVMYLDGQPIWASASSDLYGEDGNAVSR